jgi:hypothetical protein
MSDEKMTVEEAFTLGVRAGVSAARKGIDPDFLGTVLKAEAGDILAEAEADSSPDQLADKLVRLSPRKAQRERRSGERENDPPDDTHESFYDKIRSDQKKAAEPLNKGTSAADRLGTTGGF